jgi:hypothetical protein
MREREREKERERERARARLCVHVCACVCVSLSLFCVSGFGTERENTYVSYVCMYVCMYLCMHACIYVYTNTHTHIQRERETWSMLGPPHETSSGGRTRRAEGSLMYLASAGIAACISFGADASR